MSRSFDPSLSCAGFPVLGALGFDAYEIPKHLCEMLIGIDVDVSDISDHCIRELILFMFGYRLVEGYKFAKSPEDKTLPLNTLQKIYEIYKEVTE